MVKCRGDKGHRVWGEYVPKSEDYAHSRGEKKGKSKRGLCSASLPRFPPRVSSCYSTSHVAGHLQSLLHRMSAPDCLRVQPRARPSSQLAKTSIVSYLLTYQCRIARPSYIYSSSLKEIPQNFQPLFPLILP